MSVLEHVAQAAAIILLFELLIVVFIFLALSGGLAFGLHWVRGKTGWANEKLNRYSGLGARYVHIGTDYAALPLILFARFTAQARGTALALRDEVRRRQPARLAGGAHPVAAPPAEPQAPDVLT